MEKENEIEKINCNLNIDQDKINSDLHLENRRKETIKKKTTLVKPKDINELFELSYDSSQHLVIIIDDKLNFHKVKPKVLKLSDLEFCFHTSNSFNKFNTFLEQNKVEWDLTCLTLHFKFNKKEILDLQNIFLILDKFKFIGKNENEKTDVKIKVNSIVKLTTTFDERKNTNADNIQITSVIIKDRLLSFMKNANINRFLDNLKIYFKNGLTNLKQFKIKNTKFSVSNNFLYLMKLISESDSLEELFFVNVKCEFEDIISYINIDKEGVSLNFDNEKDFKMLNKLKKLEIINSKLLKIGELSKLNNILNKFIQLKFDQNSLIEEIGIDKLEKDHEKIKVKFNSQLLDHFFEGVKNVPSNVTTCVFRDMNFDSNSYNVSIFGDILSQADLLCVEKIQFERCVISDPLWLNSVLGELAMGKLQSLSLKQIYNTTYLNKFFELSTGKEINICIDDSYVELNDIVKLEKIKLNTLILKFSKLFEINFNNSTSDPVLPINKILNKIKIENLVLEGSMLNSPKLFLENSSLTNLTLKNFEINSIDRINLTCRNLHIQTNFSISLQQLLLKDEIKFENLFIDVESLETSILKLPNEVINVDPKNPQKNKLESNIDSIFNILTKYNSKLTVLFQNQKEKNMFYFLHDLLTNKELRQEYTKCQTENVEPTFTIKLLSKYFLTNTNQILRPKEEELTGIKYDFKLQKLPSKNK